MNYILKLIFFIVVLASAAYAPRVFASVEVGLAISPTGVITASDFFCDPQTGGGWEAWYIEGEANFGGTTGQNNNYSGCAGNSITSVGTNYGGIVVDGVYHLFLNVIDNVSYSTVTLSKATTTQYAIIRRSGGVWSSESEDLLTQTRIVSFIVPINSTIATGTNVVGFTGFISEEDFNDGPSYYTYSLQRISNGNTLGTMVVQTGAIDITSDGYFDYATTVSDMAGTYFQSASIAYSPWCLFGYCDPLGITSEEVVASGLFQAGTDPLNTYAETWLSNLETMFASSTVSVVTACNPLSGNFSISYCLTGLIYPGTDQVAGYLTQIRSQAPWGYGFRFYDIMNGTVSTSTVLMPKLTYTSASTSIFGIATFEFDPFQTLASSTNIIANAVSDQSEQKTVRQIFEPIVKMIVYLGLAFILIRKLFSIKREIE